MIEEGNYGTVLVIKGKFKGRIGLYDDDEEYEKAIVYFDEFPMGGYEMIKRSNLEEFGREEECE